MFKTFARNLIATALLNAVKALPALVILILAIWMVAGVILLPGCSHPKQLNPAPDYYLAMDIKETTK